MIRANDVPGWAALEQERPGEQFRVRVGGKVMEFRSPVDVPPADLVTALSEWRPFLFLLVMDQEELVETAFPFWVAEYLLRAYRLHHGLCDSSGDDRRLYDLVRKPEYRKAIEVDLQEVYGVDLGQEWRGRRWRKLLSMIDRLRRTSHLHEVIADDDDLATYLLAQEKKAKHPSQGPTRRMTEFDTNAELLSTAVDRLGELIVAVAATRGAKPRKVEPQPRPVTAMARARKRGRIAHHEFTVGRVFGRIDAAGRPTG